MTATSVTTGTTYQFAVKAVNVHGAGPLGGSASIVAYDLPGIPTALTAGSTTASSATFTWTAPTDTGGSPITDYAVAWDSGGGSFYSHKANTGGAASYTATSLLADTAYGFAVAATTAAGTGDASAIICFKNQLHCLPVSPATCATCFYA